MMGHSAHLGLQAKNKGNPTLTTKARTILAAMAGVKGRAKTATGPKVEEEGLGGIAPRDVDAMGTEGDNVTTTGRTGLILKSSFNHTQRLLQP